MRFLKIANLVNAPAVHNQKINVRTFQCPPAAHRAHTEPLPRHTEHFAIHWYIYKPWKKKNEIGYLDFHSAAPRFKKNAVFENCKFTKRARNT